MRIMLVILLAPLLAVPAFAETQNLPTSDGTLNVEITHDPIELDAQNKIGIDFINPQTERTQEHIDYTVAVTKDGEGVFGPIPLTHTSPGTVTIPIEFDRGEGTYTMDIEVEGILFQPIPKETVSFQIPVGMAMAQPDNPIDVNGNGGGCLIATAAFGSELAPQVQQLRELRDNAVMGTSSGAAFMAGFNQLYYSFSPGIADLQRSSPALNEIVRVALAPMLSSLSLLEYTDVDSEGEMLGYGISLILLNVGMYVGIPAFGILKLYQSRRD